MITSLRSGQRNFSSTFSVDAYGFMSDYVLRAGDVTKRYPIVNIDLSFVIPGSSGFHNGNKVYVENLPDRFIPRTLQKNISFSESFFIVTKISHDITSSG